MPEFGERKLKLKAQLCNLVTRSTTFTLGVPMHAVEWCESDTVLLSMKHKGWRIRPVSMQIISPYQDAAVPDFLPFLSVFPPSESSLFGSPEDSKQIIPTPDLCSSWATILYWGLPCCIPYIQGSKGELPNTLKYDPSWAKHAYLLILEGTSPDQPSQKMNKRQPLGTQGLKKLTWEWLQLIAIDVPADGDLFWQ